jgi:hypothetical protein
MRQINSIRMHQYPIGGYVLAKLPRPRSSKAVRDTDRSISAAEMFDACKHVITLTKERK